MDTKVNIQSQSVADREVLKVNLVIVRLAAPECVHESVPLYHQVYTPNYFMEGSSIENQDTCLFSWYAFLQVRISMQTAVTKTGIVGIMTHGPMTFEMDERDTRRRSCPRRRRHQRSPSSSYDSPSSSDSPSRFSRRNRRSRRRNSTSRSHSRSPHKFEHRHGYKRRHDRRSRSRDSRDSALCGESSVVKQSVNRHGEERESRRIRRGDSAKPVCESRRIAPNASALKAIMLGTARSRDRMDERDRVRAKKKLESLDATLAQ